MRIHGIVNAGVFSSKLKEAIAVSDLGIHFRENDQPLLLTYEAARHGTCESKSADLLSWATGVIVCRFTHGGERRFLFGTHEARDSFLAILGQLANL